MDAIITDPPYNISKDNNFSTMKNAKRQGVDFGEWDKNFNLFDWIKLYSPLIKDDGSFIIFCSYRYMSYIIDELEKNDFVVKDIIEWKKSNPMPRNIIEDMYKIQSLQFGQLRKMQNGYLINLKMFHT